MFWTYLGRELRRRKRQAAVVSLGLALGIGLVVTVTSMSSGVAQAQSTVLHSLYGVGTDITVTEPATAGSGGPARFQFGGTDRARSSQSFSRDRLFPAPGEQSFAESRVATVAGLPHVAAATGGLSLTAIHFNGTLPSITRPSPNPSPGFGPGSGSGGFQLGRSAFNVTTYSVQGVDVAASGVGPLSPADVTAGRFFNQANADARVAVLERSYARQHKLSVGSKISIDGADYLVIGLASDSAQSASVYIPLARAQAIGAEKAKVTTIYVKATSASEIKAVTAEIRAALPKATVTNSADLASQVTGSLASASKLAGTLGKVLSAVVLAAAFVLASLLTLSAVSRRVREFGTLKALGWRTRRVVGQVMGEAVVLGVIGGIVGIALGLGGAALASRLSPPLTASLGPSLPSGPFGRSFTGALDGLAHTVTVRLSAPISMGLFALAIALALAGGIVAGSFGGWRAARLRPAEAMRRVE